MIVISGALVLVALVLLVIGVAMPDLTFVYASIVVSLVSLVFLIIGVLQRRGSSSAAAAPSERAPVTMSRPAAERAEQQQVTAVSPRPASGGWSKAGDGGRRAATASAAPAVAVKSFPSKAAPPVDEPMDEPMDESDGTVLIVPGRPKYHVEGCRFLAGKSADEVDVLDARDDGFTPCGFCKPDAVLAGQLDEEPLELDAQDEDVAPPVPAAATSRRRSPAGGTRAVGDQSPLAARAKGALTKVGASSKFAKVLPTPSASGKGTSDTADHEPSQPVEPAAAASAPGRAATSTTGKPLVRKPGAKSVTVDPAPHKPAAAEPRLAKPVPVKPLGSRTGTGKPVPAGTAAAAATSTGKPTSVRSAPAPTTSPASAQAKPLVRKPGAKAVTVDGAPHKPAASEPKLAKPVSIKPPTRSTPAKPAPAKPAPAEPAPAKVTGGRAAATKAMPIPAPAKPAVKAPAGRPLVRKPGAQAVTVDTASRKPAASEPRLTKPVSVKPTTGASPTKPAPTRAAAAKAVPDKPEPSKATARAMPAKTAKSAPAKRLQTKPGAKAVTVDGAPHKPAASEPKLAEPVSVKPPAASRAPAKSASARKPPPAKGTAASVARARSTPQRWGSS